MKRVVVFSVIFFLIINDSIAQPARPPLSNDNAVIYELFLRDFTQDESIQSVIPRLPELKSLGINTIWIMPIHPVGKEKMKGPLGSPYSIQNFYAVNPEFGTKADFKKLADAIHAQGMYVMLDMVLNHTAWDNAWVTQHPDWYKHDANGNIVPPVADWTDVAQLNYGNADLRKEIINVLKYWVDSFGVDGYRCDAADMVPIDFWKQAITELRKDKPVYMLAEGSKPENYDAGFNLTYGWDIYGALKDIYKGIHSAMYMDSAIQRENRKYPAGSKRMYFTTDHDETSWDHTPIYLFKGIQGSEAAFTVMCLLGGVPLVYNGQEVGDTAKLEIFHKIPINWNENPDLNTFYKTILKLYNQNQVFRTGALGDLSLCTPDMIIYSRTSGSQKYLVLVNTRDKHAFFQLPEAMQKSSVKDELSGQNVNLSGTVTFNPFEYHVVRLQ